MNMGRLIRLTTKRLISTMMTTAFIVPRLETERSDEVGSPHCGYDLRLLPMDPKDAVTVCPECGCASRLDETADSGVTSPLKRP